MSSSAPLQHPHQSSPKTLTQKIAEEERLIRIYEAELAFETAQRKRRRSETILSHDDAEALFQRGNSNNNDGGSDDWLLEQTLEALQSSSSSTAVASRSADLAAFLRFEMTQWQNDDDPALERLLPFLSGICIENVQNVVLSNAQHCRSYRIQGRVCAANTTPFSFQITLTVELSTNDAEDQRKNTRAHRRGHHTVFSSKMPDQARVVALEADFARGDTDKSNDENDRGDTFPSEELSSIAKVASETCNLPLLVRQLVSLAQFNHRRVKLLSALHQELASTTAGGLVLERSSAHEFSLTRRDTNNNNNNGLVCTVILEWKWNVTWHSRGCDNLSIKDVIVPKAVTRGDEIGILLRPQGLENLVTCTGGSVERAIRIMVQTMTHQGASHHNG